LDLLRSPGITLDSGVAASKTTVAADKTSTKLNPAEQRHRVQDVQVLANLCGQLVPDILVVLRTRLLTTQKTLHDIRYLVGDQRLYLLNLAAEEFEQHGLVSLELVECCTHL
jgi:hypothetical protein